MHLRRAFRDAGRRQRHQLPHRSERRTKYRLFRTAGADKGKTAASHITQTSLAEKNRMIRQKEDAAKK